METIKKQLENLIAAQAGDNANQDQVAELAAKLEQILTTSGQGPDKSSTEPA